jgi:hypothetical protein
MSKKTASAPDKTPAPASVRLLPWNDTGSAARRDAAEALALVLVLQPRRLEPVVVERNTPVGVRDFQHRGEPVNFFIF